MGRAVAHAFSKSVNVRLLQRLSWPRGAARVFPISYSGR